MRQAIGNEVCVCAEGTPRMNHRLLWRGGANFTYRGRIAPATLDCPFQLPHRRRHRLLPFPQRGCGCGRRRPSLGPELLFPGGERSPGTIELGACLGPLCLLGFFHTCHRCRNLSTRRLGGCGGRRALKTRQLGLSVAGQGVQLRLVPGLRLGHAQLGVLVPRVQVRNHLAAGRPGARVGRRQGGALGRRPWPTADHSGTSAPEGRAA
eukprot:scaffold5870_cov93-Isochrysis_galbana.AAC.4